MRLGLALAVVLLAACTSTLIDYETRTHVVRPGETLYTIAWNYGLDHRALAAWNNLDDPDVIFAGQRLRLRAAETPQRPGTPAASQRAAPPPLMPAPSWQWPTRGPIVSGYGAAGAIGSGIGIGGRSGQSVRAAAAGRVVYAGSGLIGYGQLVIIKHNETYLTAYGHNSRVLVAQGQELRQGDTIAEMGLGPGQTPRLHFEIRRNGVPVNPLQYLPR